MTKSEEIIVFINRRLSEKKCGIHEVTFDRQKSVKQDETGKINQFRQLAMLEREKTNRQHRFRPCQPKAIQPV